MNKLRKKSIFCWSLLNKYIRIHGPENMKNVQFECLVLLFGTLKSRAQIFASDWKFFLRIWVFFFTVIHFVTLTLVTPRLAWAYYDVTGFGFCPLNYILNLQINKYRIPRCHLCVFYITNPLLF